MNESEVDRAKDHHVNQNGFHEQSNGKLRHRRTRSVGRAEEIQEHDRKLRRAQPDKPCHRPRDSLFSWTSGFNDFAGFVTWAFLLLGMGGVRLILENFIKYGIRVDPWQWIIVLTGQNVEGNEYPSLILLVYSSVFVILSLAIEKGLAKGLVSDCSGLIAHVINLVVLLLLPIIVIHIKGTACSFIGATTVCFVYSVLFLKLWSYIHVNHWCRIHYRSFISDGKRRKSITVSTMHRPKKPIKVIENESDTDTETSEENIKQYPDNLTISDIMYFLFVPTLCYELNFPKTTRIRKRFLIKRIFEVFVGVQIILAVIQQYIVPSVKNSLIPFSNMDFIETAERLLKLAIPNHLCWLIFFYLSFHSLTNLIGELMHFADRNFYCDWWNSNNIDTFWRSWNMPVHRWAVRHIYIPVVNLGYNKNIASGIVFFISAFFHEYLVSVPLKTFKIWAFTGMMGQIPLSMLSRYVEKRWGPRMGNMIVWSSIIVGQPLCIMMYYHDYIITHHGQDLLVSFTEL